MRKSRTGFSCLPQGVPGPPEQALGRLAPGCDNDAWQHQEEPDRRAERGSRRGSRRRGRCAPSAGRTWSRWPATCSRRRAIAPRPCARSRTPPGSCPAACTTTSTPRSRSATRSCRASSTRYSATTAPRSPRPRARGPCSSRSCARPAAPSPSTGRPWPCCSTTGIYFATQPRFAYLPKALREIERIWISQLELGKQAGLFRADLDAKLTYRLLRDVLWIPAQWRRTRGYSTEQVVDGFLRILFDGIVAGAGSPQGLRDPRSPGVAVTLAPSKRLVD